jgi:hypothetical protein
MPSVADMTSDHYIKNPVAAEQAIHVWATDDRKLGWAGAVNVVGALVAVVAKLLIRVTALELKQVRDNATEKQKTICETEPCGCANRISRYNG